MYIQKIKSGLKETKELCIEFVTAISAGMLSLMQPPIS